MDNKELPTLLNLAIQHLLNNEPAAIHALEEIPRELFVPLFSAAFKGGHKNIVKAMVKVWPFVCLHIGSLRTRESQRELLKAMVESLQFLPVQNSASRSPKLRILDLRQDVGCKIICPESSAKSPACFHFCAYSEHSILKIEGQFSMASSEPGAQSSKQAMELLVNLSLGRTLRETEFLVLLLNKVEQSSGSLHLCCRDLQIDKLCDCRNTLHYLDLKCIDHLAVDQASLSEVTTLLAQVVHLDRLCLCKITCRSLNGEAFRNFIFELGRMDHLNELNLSSFCLTDHLENVLRVLPASLEFLHLPFCGLSYNDFKFLSECPQANHLKLLNISNNPMNWEDSEPLYNLLRNNSSTLQQLAINHCLLTDSTISVLISALNHCSQLRILNFSSNPLTMTMLMRILEHLTSLVQLKYVFYPIPVHCYGRWHFQDSLDRQKLADVQAQLKRMLQEAERNDMHWITFSD
ncbi:melanoma antigen preferentially expressed in tumors-like [Peromyscus eremicus]|uniref:melanoma antigen preferentially expressed in tumors-like n=1 Tax=Peromyscus eremicus TaxID=42410 RepID=UPI0027DACE8C|nr:melanoma antigen preferentially expressed in tumors-like [Peromyscus eremicus]XP_059106771.1 melanoma antigen preferentially expressed in tumors-like [Peromyscus eremicus]